MFVYLFAFVPRGLGIKIQTECRGEHSRGEILSLLTARIGDFGLLRNRRP